ncbi:MAG: hypothetical protein ACOY94_18915 [Bacillota bacterium]
MNHESRGDLRAGWVEQLERPIQRHSARESGSTSACTPASSSQEITYSPLVTRAYSNWQFSRQEQLYEVPA